MATPYYVKNLTGMNRTLNPLQIKDGDLKLCLNYNSDVASAKKKRLGYATFLNNPDSSQVYNLIEERLSSGRFVLRVSGTSIYKYSFTGSTWGSAVRTGIGYVADQSQTYGQTTGTGNLLDATTDYLAQGFQTSVTDSCQYVDVLLLKHGSPGNLTLRIETDTAGSPSGTLVNAAATATITTAATTGNLPTADAATWVTVKFATAFSLTASTQYHIVIRPSATADATNYVQWIGSTSNLYSSGVLKISTNSGSSYAATSTTVDGGFAVYLQTECRMGSTVLNNLVILGNGGDRTLSYDGTTFTEIVDATYTSTYAPRCPYWLTYKGRAYCFAPNYAKSRGFFSETSDPTSWVNDPNDVSTGNWFDVDPDFNGNIIGAEVIDDRIIVHKEHGSYRLIPDEFGRPAEILPIPTTNVSSSHWAIKEVNGTSIYPAQNGIYMHKGVTPTLISYPIKDLADGITDSVRDDLCAGVWDNHYYLSAMGNITEDVRLGEGYVARTYTNAVLVYNSLMNEWYIYTFGHKPTCFETWLDVNGTEYLYFGDNLGNTWTFGSGTLDGTLPIHAEVEIWPMTLGVPDKTKDIDQVAILTDRGCEASAMFKFDDMDWEPIGDTKSDYTSRLVRDLGGSRRNISFKVIDSSVTTGSVVYGFVASVAVWDMDPSEKRMLT